MWSWVSASTWIRIKKADGGANAKTSPGWGLLRVDLYLKLMGITKTRMAAKRLCDGQKILVRGKLLRPSSEIFESDILDLFLPQKELRLKILEVPPGKSVAKRDRSRYMALEIVREW